MPIALRKQRIEELLCRVMAGSRKKFARGIGATGMGMLESMLRPRAARLHPCVRTVGGMPRSSPIIAANTFGDPATTRSENR